MGLLDVVVVLLLVGFGLWLLGKIDAVDPAIRQIIRGFVILVVVLWLVKLLVGDIPIPSWRGR